MIILNSDNIKTLVLSIGVSDNLNDFIKFCYGAFKDIIVYKHPKSIVMLDKYESFIHLKFIATTEIADAVDGICNSYKINISSDKIIAHSFSFGGSYLSVVDLYAYEINKI